jgi:hypothetical protein
MKWLKQREEKQQGDAPVFAEHIDLEIVLVKFTVTF